MKGVDGPTVECARDAPLSSSVPQGTEQARLVIDNSDSSDAACNIVDVTTHVTRSPGDRDGDAHARALPTGRGGGEGGGELLGDFGELSSDDGLGYAGDTTVAPAIDLARLLQHGVLVEPSRPRGSRGSRRRAEDAHDIDDEAEEDAEVAEEDYRQYDNTEGDGQFGYNGDDILKAPTKEEREVLMESPIELFREEIVPRVARLLHMCCEVDGEGSIGGGNLLIWMSHEPHDEEDAERRASVPGGQDMAMEYYRDTYAIGYPGDGEMPFLTMATNCCRTTVRPRYVALARMITDYEGAITPEALRGIVGVYGAKAKANPVATQTGAAATTRHKEARKLQTIIHSLMTEANIPYVLAVAPGAGTARYQRLKSTHHGYSKYYPALNLAAAMFACGNADDVTALPTCLERHMLRTSSMPDSDPLYAELAPLCGLPM